MKYSKQREEIYKIVLNSCDHPNVDTIYYRVKKEIPNISLGTVYRNLSTLYNNGLIRKITNPNGGDHYDKTLIDHAHLFCTYCQKMYDVDTNTLKNIKDLVEQKNNCIIKSSEIIFTGQCCNCKKKENI